MGNIAINDFLLIEATIYKLLKKHIRQKPYYVDVLDLFHEVSVNYTAILARGVTAIYGYIGMCRCEGYGFQAVYSSIGYTNQSVWV